MKKNFTKAVLLALAVTSMGTFNSCKDHDDCGIDRIELEILKDKNAKLDDVVKAQTSQIEELIKQIEAIKECNCKREHGDFSQDCLFLLGAVPDKAEISADDCVVVAGEILFLGEKMLIQLADFNRTVSVTENVKSHKFPFGATEQLIA